MEQPEQLDRGPLPIFCHLLRPAPSVRVPERMENLFGLIGDRQQRWRYAPASCVEMSR
jgi:hypothetical protein